MQGYFSKQHYSIRQTNALLFCPRLRWVSAPCCCMCPPLWQLSTSLALSLSSLSPSGSLQSSGRWPSRCLLHHQHTRSLQLHLKSQRRERERQSFSPNWHWFVQERGQKEREKERSEESDIPKMITLPDEVLIFEIGPLILHLEL